jgi:hypothetical protein
MRPGQGKSGPVGGRGRVAVRPVGQCRHGSLDAVRAPRAGQCGLHKAREADRLSQTPSAVAAPHATGQRPAWMPAESVRGRGRSASRRAGCRWRAQGSLKLRQGNMSSGAAGQRSGRARQVTALMAEHPTQFGPSPQVDVRRGFLDDRSDQVTKNLAFRYVASLAGRGGGMPQPPAIRSESTPTICRMARRPGAADQPVEACSRNRSHQARRRSSLGCSSTAVCAASIAPRKSPALSRIWPKTS